MLALPLLLPGLALAQALVEPPLPGAVCSFAESRPGPQMEVAVLGTDVVFGTIGDWGGDPRLVARLGEDRGAPVLRVAARGGGLSLVADVDPRQQSALSLVNPIDTPTALLVAGAFLHVVGFEAGQVRVEPDLYRGSSFQASPPFEPLLRCEDLRISEYLSPDFDDQILVAAGAKGRPEVVLPAGARFSDAPGGSPIGRLPRKAGERSAHVLETSQGWSRVALTEWAGVAWRGWVPTASLRPADEGAGGLGMLGGLAEGNRIELRACQALMPLYAAHRGSLLTVGQVEAGTRFELRGDGPMGSVRVAFPHLWLEGRDDTPLVLPSAAGACPVVAVDSPASLEDVLRGGG